MVAGATGVVGRALVPLLTSVGHDVVALARTPGRRPPA
ncbi:NAD-dependent epimerase/dehydratase family protein [Streptomyces sp. NPDC058475]